ncbi:MAG TPA: acetyltransferase [Peptococcaceae bacterium]|nr:acetyltransferase [Peptococcaceae bacterium]
MKDLVIFGAGNLGRETAQLVEDINMDKKQWNLLGFIDDTPEKQGQLVNNHLVLGNMEWLKKKSGSNLWIVCAIGEPRAKYHIIRRLSEFALRYANLIHPNVGLNKTIEMGVGNIICWNTFLSVNTKIGNHVVLNPSCGIGHDTVIDDYSSLYWNVTLAGNVRINQGCELGSKSVVIPKKVVGRWSVIGAGAVVTEDIPEYCLAVGVPARPLKQLETIDSSQ